ncbi:MAG TPA: zinc dependent phospholipase C family protein [Dehalococcoidia bacterium]|jgi:hypothetical protein
MPLMGLHLTVARQLADDANTDAINRERGAYYLGATTPDIRAMTRRDREETHFFRLDDFGPQSGVQRMFREHPALLDPAKLDAATVAFMAGYVSHLVLDEDYISEIYRPFFGVKSDVADDVLANVMDRLLQMHLDRERRPDAESVSDIRCALEAASADVAVEFVARESLREWHGLQLEFLARPPQFERMLRRHLTAVGVEGEDAISDWLEQNTEKLLRGTLDRIGEERIREYMNDTQRRAATAVKEYLS